MKNFNLEKFNRSNLFTNKKITSTIEEYQLQKALEVKKYESNVNIRGDLALKLNNSNNSNNNLRYHFEKIEKKKVFNRNSSIGRLTNGKNISLKNGAKIQLKSKDFILRDSIHRNSVKIPESIINKSQLDSKSTILPYLSSSTTSIIHKIPNKKTEMKVKPFLRLKGKVASQPDIFEKTNGFKKNREDF